MNVKTKDLILENTMLAQKVTNNDRKIRELNLQVDELGNKVATTDTL